MRYNIVIDKELSTYINRLDYEYTVQKNVVAFMFDIYKDQNIAQWESFKNFYKELEEKEISYITAINELKKTILPEEIYNGGHKYSFKIDYDKHTVMLDIICDCGNKIYNNWITQEKKND